MTTSLPAAFAVRDSVSTISAGTGIEKSCAQVSFPERSFLQSGEICRRQFLKMERRGGKARFYASLAGIFAKLRLYPLAMKCFFHSAEKNGMTADSLYDENEVRFTYDDSLKIVQNGFLRGSPPDKSLPVEVQSFIGPFTRNDTTVRPVAYAVILHIKQPVTGRRKVFNRPAKVGHTFITLIVYNSDSTSISRSFGFYPKKDHLFSATPIFPATKSVFKDDAEHEWDELVARFVPGKKFERVLKVIQRYEGHRYNLNKNNCTDFGLSIALEAGISISDTRGSWFLGRGNNPGSAGQSVIEGKVTNADTNDRSGLLILTP